MPKVISVNKFDETSAKEFRSSFEEAVNTNQPVIPVVIDSYGGQVYSLLSIVEVIKSSPVPVATIISGKAFSCGAVLFTCGTEGYRYMGPQSTLMIHDVSSGSFGKVKDLKTDLEESERLNKIIYALMAQNCGKDTDYFNKLVHSMSRTDWYLTPKDAMKHGIANHIRIPKLVVKASVTMKLE